jgi:hypothetical protein
MRRLSLLALTLVLAACAPRVQQPAPVSRPTGERPGGATMVGLTANDLISRFGQPSFQVKEGVGTKLQWSQNGCVLDAYLYPPGNGRVGDRVTHVDSRQPSGADLPLNACLDLMRR